MKKYLIASFCLLTSFCFGDGEKPITIDNDTKYTDNDHEEKSITHFISNLPAENAIIQLTITADPTMEKTWCLLILASTSGKTGIKLELTAKDGALNKENLEYLAECLLSVSNNITLTKLYISGNNLMTGNYFNDYISSCSELTTIDISKNKSNFCYQFLDRLGSKKITSLKASECGLSARSFEKVLNLNPDIATLDLSKNEIDILTRKFADGLQKTAIAILDLSNNKELFKNPYTVVQLLTSINGKEVEVRLAGTNYSGFIKDWLAGKRSQKNIFIPFAPAPAPEPEPEP